VAVSLTSSAGLGWLGIGFVVLAIIINLIYACSGLPVPGSRLNAVAESFAAPGDALRRP
jgi:hypothetical protein